MLKITPRGKVIGSMPQDEAEDTPVLLSLNAEPVGTETVKMSIDVVFQSVLLERPIGKGYWSIGSTGAELRFRAAGAAIGAHTAGSKISVKYKIANGKERTITAKVEPTVEVGEDVKASVGEFGFEGKTSAGGEAEYESHESPLAVIEKGDTVVWQQAITRGKKSCGITCSALSNFGPTASGEQRASRDMSDYEIRLFSSIRKARGCPAGKPC